MLNERTRYVSPRRTGVVRGDCTEKVNSQSSFEELGFEEQWSKLEGHPRATGNDTVLPQPAPELTAASRTSYSPLGTSNRKRIAQGPQHLSPHRGAAGQHPPRRASVSGPSGPASAEAACSGEKGWDTVRATAQAHLDGYHGAAGPFEQVSAAHGARAPGVPLAGESAASSPTSDGRGRRGGGWCADVDEPRSLRTRGSREV